MRRRVMLVIGAAAVCVTAAIALSASPFKPPTSLSASGSDKRVTLAWSASGSSRVTGYRVYRRGTNQKWPSTPLARTRALSYTDRRVVNGSVYAYRVTPSRTATATAGPAAGPCGRTADPPAGYDHVVWVVMENKAYRSIIRSPNAPYENQLAAQCASAVNFFAEEHPSLPNYIAMTSGSPHGISDDRPPSSHRLRGPSIFSQLGRGWRALQESMPAHCRPTNAGRYAVKHNPAAYYTNIRGACASLDVPLRNAPDLSARFTFVTPNLCSDTHNCSVATGDAWLHAFLRKVFASAEYRAGSTAVFLTWDEDDSSHSNHIPTIVAAPSVVPGSAPTARFNHYSMLRTTEEMLGLGLLGHARSATSMRSAFGI